MQQDDECRANRTTWNKTASDRMSIAVNALLSKALRQWRNCTDSSLAHAWSAYFPWLKGATLREQFLKCRKEIVTTIEFLVSNLENHVVPLDGFLSAEDAIAGLLALVLVMKSVGFIDDGTKHLLDGLFSYVDRALLCLPATKHPVIGACLFSSPVELHASETVDLSTPLELETDEKALASSNAHASQSVLHPSLYVILVRTARDVSWLCDGVLLLRRQATLRLIGELPRHLTGSSMAMLHESSWVAPERSDLLDLFSRLQWAALSIVSAPDDARNDLGCKGEELPLSSPLDSMSDRSCSGPTSRFIHDVFRPRFEGVDAPAFHLLVVGDESSCYRAMLCCLSFTLRLRGNWVPRYVVGFPNDAVGLSDPQSSDRRVVWLIDAIRAPLDCLPQESELASALDSYVVFVTTAWADTHSRTGDDTFCVCEVAEATEAESASPPSAAPPQTRLSPLMRPDEPRMDDAETAIPPAPASPKIMHNERASSASAGSLPYNVVRPASVVWRAPIQEELLLAGRNLRTSTKFSEEHLWVKRYEMRFLTQLPRRLTDELAKCAVDLRQRIVNIANDASNTAHDLMKNPSDKLEDASRAVLTILLYVSPLGPLFDEYLCQADVPLWTADFATCLDEALCRLPPVGEPTLAYGCLLPDAVVAGRHPFVRFKTSMPLLGDKNEALNRFVEQHHEGKTDALAVVRTHSARDVSWASSHPPHSHWLLPRETVLHFSSALPEVATTAFPAEARVQLMFEVFSLPHSLGASESSSNADTELVENMVELSRASFGLLRAPCMDLTLRMTEPLKGPAMEGRFFEHLIPAVMNDDKPRMVLLIGESGSGKSALLLETFGKVLDRLDLKATWGRPWFPIFHDLVEKRGVAHSAALVDDVRWLCGKFRVVVLLNTISTRMADELMDFACDLCEAGATVIVAVRPSWIGTHRSSIPATCIRAELQPLTEQDVKQHLEKLAALARAGGEESTIASDLQHAAKRITSPVALRYAALAHAEIANLHESVTEYDIMRLGVEKQILISATHVTKRESDAMALARDVRKTLLDVFFRYFTSAQGQFKWSTKVSPRKQACLWKFVILENTALYRKAQYVMRPRDEISCACCAAMYIAAQPLPQRIQSYRACNSPTALRHMMDWHSTMPWTGVTTAELFHVAALACEVGSDAMFAGVMKVLPPIESISADERYNQLILEGKHFRGKKDYEMANKAFRAAFELSSDLNGGDKSRSTTAEYELATTCNTLELLLSALVMQCSLTQRRRFGIEDSMRAAFLRVLIAEQLAHAEDATLAVTSRTHLEQAVASRDARMYLDEAIETFEKFVKKRSAAANEAGKWLFRAVVRQAELNLQSGKGALELVARAFELKDTFQLEEDDLMYDALRVQAKIPKKDGDPREVKCALKRSILNMSCWVFPPGDVKIQKAYAELRQDEEQNVRDLRRLLEMVQKDGLKLSCAATKLQGDCDLVLTAVRQNGNALQYASAALKENRRVVFAATWQNKEANRHAPDTPLPMNPVAILRTPSHDDIIAELFYASGRFTQDAHKLNDHNINPMRPLSGFTLDKVETVSSAILESLAFAYNALRPRTQSVMVAEAAYTDEEQKVVLGMLRQLISHQGSVSENLLFVYHGCSAEAAAKICETGFRVGTSKRDGGYFGSGVYTTPNAEYACKYSATVMNGKKARGAPNSCPVILSIAAVDRVYPVTRSVDYTSSGSVGEGDAPPSVLQHSVLFGQPLKDGSTAHFAVISPKLTNFEACVPCYADYAELCSSHDATLCPIAVLWVKRSVAQ